MAVKYWVNTTDGDITSASSYSPSGTPTASDTVVCDGDYATVGMVSGLGSAIAFSQLRTTPNWNLAIGTSAESLLYNLSNGGNIIHEGTGSMFVAALGSDDHEIVVNSANLVYAMQISSGGGGENVFIDRGRVVIGAGVVRNVYVNGADALLDTFGLTCDDFEITAGSVEVNGLAANNGVEIAGGRLTAIGDGTTVATINVNGGAYYHNTSTGLSGILNVSSGLADFTVSFTEKTLAAVYLGPDAEFRTHEGVTITKLVDRRGDTIVIE